MCEQVGQYFCKGLKAFCRLPTKLRNCMSMDIFEGAQRAYISIEYCVNFLPFSKVVFALYSRS